MKHLKMTGALLLAITLCFSLALFQEYKGSNVIASTTSTTTSVEVANTAYKKTASPVIVLDAGHGGYDSGSVSQDGDLEKDITLSITLKVGEILEAANYQVVYTRESDDVTWESDNLSDLRSRVSIASQANADYFISIHTNFSNYNDGAYGFETYVDYENDTIVEVANAIHEELTALQYSVDRGLKNTEDSSLYVIDKNSIPAMLLEVGFLSDADDTYELLYEQEELAQAIANGIMSTI